MTVWLESGKRELSTSIIAGIQSIIQMVLERRLDIFRVLEVISCWSFSKGNESDFRGILTVKSININTNYFQS